MLQISFIRRLKCSSSPWRCSNLASNHRILDITRIKISKDVSQEKPLNR